MTEAREQNTIKREKIMMKKRMNGEISMKLMLRNNTVKSPQTQRHKMKSSMLLQGGQNGQSKSILLSSDVQYSLERAIHST